MSEDIKHYINGHVQYSFLCTCPRCKSLMKEIKDKFYCLKCGTVIDKKTNEIR